VATSMPVSAKSDELRHLIRQQAHAVDAHRKVHGADGGLDSEVHMLTPKRRRSIATSSTNVIADTTC
jgi:ribosomal protein S3AE